jgi:hypothetical protein
VTSMVICHALWELHKRLGEMPHSLPAQFGEIPVQMPRLQWAAYRQSASQWGAEGAQVLNLLARIEVAPWVGCDKEVEYAKEVLWYTSEQCQRMTNLECQYLESPDGAAESRYRSAQDVRNTRDGILGMIERYLSNPDAGFVLRNLGRLMCLENPRGTADRSVFCDISLPDFVNARLGARIYARTREELDYKPGRDALLWLTEQAAPAQ